MKNFQQEYETYIMSLSLSEIKTILWNYEENEESLEIPAEKRKIMEDILYNACENLDF